MDPEKKTPPKLKIEVKELSIQLNEENARRLGFVKPLFEFVPDLIELAKVQEAQAAKRGAKRKSEDILSMEFMDSEDLVRRIPPDIKVIRLKVTDLVIEGE